MNRSARLALIAGLSIVATTRVSQTWAANYSWNVPSGNWTTAGNWNPSTVPGPSDNAWVVNGGTDTINFNQVASCGTLTVGGAASGTVQLFAGSNLTVGGGGELIGFTSTGTFYQPAGNNTTTTNGLVLGVNTGSTGSYNLVGGSLAASNVYIGNSGIGAFTQSGGTNSSANNVYLGNNTNGNGSYNLGGSGYIAAATEFIGNSGTGAFTQTGGTNSVINNAYLGYNASGNGSYNLSGSGYLAAPTEYVGNVGVGTFTHSGGTNSTNTVILGNTGSGSYNLSGSGYLAAPTEYVGNLSIGTFNHSGGTNSVTNNLYVGYNGGGNGSYNLSGSGYLAAPTEIVGNLGTGAFTQSGGTNSVSSIVVVGANSVGGTYSQSGGVTAITGAGSLVVGSNGSYNLSSSGSLIAANEYLDSFTQSGGANSVSGNLAVGNNASGTYSQSGGVTAITGTGSLFVGYNGNGGAYLLSGSGLLTAPTEFISNGDIGQSGGTNSVAGALSIAGSNLCDYILAGGLLTAGTISVGGSSGTSTIFLQTGGTTSAPSINLVSGAYLGNIFYYTYNLQGGLLNAGTVTVGPQAIFAQSGGTVGPGMLSNFGTFIYSGGAFNAQLINSGSCALNASFYAGQGIQNFGNLTVPAGIVVGTNGGASTLDNEATITLAGGTLAGGAAAGSGGPILNNGLITGYGGLTSGVGITNNVQITLSGGNLAISTGTSTITNAGAISLVSGYQLRLTSGTLLNSGNINLNTSTIAGSGLIDNASGVVTGPGTITAPFQNSGELVVPPGPTNITQPFVNTNAIVLGGFGANLTGGSISNSGFIQGAGVVASPVSNVGTIEPLNGTLVFSGAMQNGALGLIQPVTGSQITISLGLAANFGTINLTGGVFDNNSFALSNSGEISGYGTLRTGGLTNHAKITLTGAVSTVNGPVTNASGGSISVSYNPAIFTGAVVNNGFVKSTGTTVTWAGGFTNNATYLSDPAVNYFSSLANDAGGLLQGGNGDQFFVTGALTNAGQIDLGGTSTMVVGNGAGILTQTSGTLELGTSATLSAGTVQIDGGILLADGAAATITANLIYDSTSRSTYQGMLAGAANSLTVNNPAAVLVLSGSNTYAAGTNVMAGTLILTSPAAVRDGTSLTVGNVAAFAPVISSSSTITPVPEPGTLALSIAGAALLAICRRRR